MELHACYFKDLGALSTDQRRASATAGKTGTRATGQRNWPTHPAVPPGTDDQNSTPARELEPPQPLLRSLDGGQHPCAKIGANRLNRLGTLTYAGAGCHDPRQARADAGEFFRELREQLDGESLPYLWVPEWHP